MSEEIIRGATISPCGLYRYSLWRVWIYTLPRLVLVMLNPSTADAYADDPTIRKGMGFAHRLGMGGVTVVNLFAFRATNPKDMLLAKDPFGPKNNAHLNLIGEMTTEGGGMLLCAWGKGGSYRNAGEAFLARMKERGIGPLYCLDVNQDGSPKHPLYVPYEQIPFEYRGTCG